MTCAELQQQNASRKGEIARKWVGVRHPGLEKVAQIQTAAQYGLKLQESLKFPCGTGYSEIVTIGTNIATHQE